MKAEMTVNLADYDEVKEAIAERDRLRVAMEKLNRLRSNMVMTQSASWSNSMYPLVAILNEAGYEVEGATDEQRAEHLACYGGAGEMPKLLDHTPPPETFVGNVGHGVVGDDMPGAVKILVERHRQVHEEGWTPEHDDEHDKAELARAAACYLASWLIDDDGAVSFLAEHPPHDWPWDHSWWKPSDDPARNLVKAGALVAAEIDRLERRG